MPVDWEDLGPDLRPSDFNIGTAIDILKGRGHDPWADYEAARQTLTDAIRTLMAERPASGDESDRPRA